jgi:hypothetical protein
MVKTTVYLPDRLKAALARLAETTGESEASLIRRAIESLERDTAPAPPTLPLFTSGDPSLADQVDQALDGFGLR